MIKVLYLILISIVYSLGLTHIISWFNPLGAEGFGVLVYFYVVAPILFFILLLVFLLFRNKFSKTQLKFLGFGGSFLLLLTVFGTLF